MAEKEEVVKEKLKHTGFFVFADLYKFAHAWFVEKEVGVNEDKYIEKNGGTGRELEIEWKGVKTMGDYFKQEYKLKFKVKDLTDVEVEIDGQKKAMNKGEVEIELTGLLIYDYEGKWETSAWNRFLRDVYNKFIVPSRVESMKDLLKADVRDLKEQLKSFLDLTATR